MFINEAETLKIENTQNIKKQHGLLSFLELLPQISLIVSQFSRAELIFTDLYMRWLWEKRTSLSAKN